MNGPDDELRVEIARRMEEVENEDELSELLARIEGALAEDVELVEGEADRLLDAAAQWASLASYAVARFYGPASPWPQRDLAGWGREAVERLRRIASLLHRPLSAALNATGASSFSISVGFPWGVSIGLSWP